MRYLFSACLLGINCKYDGKNNLREEIFDIFKKEGGIVVCPEQLGGLPTPREPAQFYGGMGKEVFEGKAKLRKIYSNEDVTENFIRGAKEVLHLAKIAGVKEAFLKDKSPSCGVSHVYLGGELVDGMGVTAFLLMEHGIIVHGVK